MKKKVFFRQIILFVGILLFTSIVTSCGGCNDKYLNGDTCGKAEVGGTNPFSKMREYYCEEFIHEYYTKLANNQKDDVFNKYSNYVTHEDSETKETITGVFDDKYSLVDNNLVLVKNTEETAKEYLQAHFIFVYYTTANKEMVDKYIDTNIKEPSVYKELVDICANGLNIPTVKSYGYFAKINDTNRDGDTKDIKDEEDESTNDNKKEKVTVTAVSNRLSNHSKACYVFSDDFVDPQTGVSIPKSTWGGAWKDNGLLHGLLVFPMSWLINVFVTLFGGTGWAQVFAIIVVTCLLKLLILLLTFKSQSSTQKMQDIQPEILKIQAKYGQNPSAADKQKMSMELMSVYQKYGVKPFAPFLSLLVTFPVFIAMYRAVMNLGVLRTGNIGGVVLGNGLSTYIIGGNFKVTALIIFIIMAASQILSMKLPQMLNKKRMSEEAKKQQKQTSMMTNVFMIMILVMGFTMPVVMSIYWIASAAVGMLQSYLMHKLNNGNKGGKYKVKKEETKYTIPQGYKN